MEKYLNLGRDSGVQAYEIGPEHIRVMFTTGAIYVYNYESAGSVKIQEMKRLAKQGEGLNSFINREVRKLYAYRER